MPIIVPKMVYVLFMLFAHLSHRHRKWIALAGLVCGVSILFLDSTVLPVATPTIQKDLGVTSTGVNWIINIYFLTMATLVLAMGRFADKFGHRRIFTLGIGIFAIASLLGGFAQMSNWLITSRAFQGVGAAMMGPASWAIIIDVFPLKERGRAAGVLIGISSVFLSLGPSIGGFLTEYLSWRWIFWINLPVALLGIFLVLISVPQTELSDERFDIPGFVTFSAGLAALTTALMQGRDWGWNSPLIIMLGLLAVLFFFLLVVTDRMAKDPFIDFKLYRKKVYLGGSCLVFFAQFLLMISVYWPIFFQKALNLTPLEAGSVTLFATLPVIFSAPLSGYLNDRFGPKIPILIGFVMSALCLSWFAIFLRFDRVLYLIPGLFFYGNSMALVMTPNSTSALGTLRPGKRGLGSGMFYTARYTGGALGIALFGSLIINIRHLNFTLRLQNNPETANLSARIFWGLMTDSKSAVAQLNALPEKTAIFVKEAFYASYNYAFTLTHIFALLIALTAIAVSYWTYRDYVPEEDVV